MPPFLPTPEQLHLVGYDDALTQLAVSSPLDSLVRGELGKSPFIVFLDDSRVGRLLEHVWKEISRSLMERGTLTFYASYVDIPDSSPVPSLVLVASYPSRGASLSLGLVRLVVEDETSSTQPLPTSMDTFLVDPASAGICLPEFARGTIFVTDKRSPNPETVAVNVDGPTTVQDLLSHASLFNAIVSRTRGTDYFSRTSSCSLWQAFDLGDAVLFRRRGLRHLRNAVCSAKLIKCPQPVKETATVESYARRRSCALVIVVPSSPGREATCPNVG